MKIKYIIIKGKHDKHGNIPVWWRFYSEFNKKTKIALTGVVLPPKNIVKGRIVNTTYLQTLDQALEKLVAKATPIILQQPDILPGELWKRIKNMKTPNDIDFFDFFHNVWLEKYGKKMSDTRRKGMIATVNTFARLLDIKKLTVREINDRIRHILNDFGSKLDEQGYKTAKCDYILNMKQLIGNMADYYNDPEEIVKTWQLDHVEVPKREEGGAKELTIKQVKTIFAMRFDNEPKANKENLILARNVFLLSFCLMGANLTDLYKCKMVSKDRICFNRSKVKKIRRDHGYIEMDIPCQLQEIFNLYRDPTGERAFVFYSKTPNYRSFLNRINRWLKPIGKRFGIDNLVFYAARKSMSTIARNDVEISLETINEMQVHSNENQKLNEIYIAPDKKFRRVNEANKKLMDFMWGDTILPSLKE